MEIKITKCRPEGISPQFANITPDSIHTVSRELPHKPYKPKGYWVNGIEEEVFVLRGECVVLEEGTITRLDASLFRKGQTSYTSPTAPGKTMDGMEMVKHVFSNLTAEQRVDVFNGYCCVCGSDNPMCPCEDE